MVLGAPINIGSEHRYADIVVYRDEISAKNRDQAGIRIVVETKAPTSVDDGPIPACSGQDSRFQGVKCIYNYNF